MYKDLSLKEKARVIREGVRLGLNSIDDILSLYDEAISYLKEGPIVSPYGLWQYPGRDTIIPSNNITMDNVNYPVLGISDTGDAKVMMPWNNYKFRGSMVYEHPLIGNQFQLGGNTKPTFDLWYPTVPKLKNDTSSYDLRRAYNTLPFDEMENFRTIDNYHLPSVAYDEKTDTYTFLKRNGHPTLNYELDWYNSGNPEALEFRERYQLDTLSLPWRYIPRTYLEGGNTLNYLNIPEYNIALYNTVSPLGDFPNLWEALAYRRLVKNKLKNGNIYERDYPVGNTQGEKTAIAAWAKRLGLPYDELDLPVYNGDTVTLPYSLVLEIPYDTNMLKNRIQLNKALLDRYSKYRYSNVVNAAIEADLYNLDKLRETYKTGEPVGLTEFGWNSRLLVNNGEIVPIENIQSPLNVLGNYNVRYSPEERRLYYSDEYDFNQFENFVPGEPFRIRGYIDLDNNKALGGNLFKKGGIYINPKNKGKFNATKKRMGKTTEELTHSKNPLTRKRAIFAQNAARWSKKHQNGGYIDYNLNPDLRKKYVFDTPIGGYKDFYMPYQESVPELKPIQPNYINSLTLREQQYSDNFPIYNPNFTGERNGVFYINGNIVGERGLQKDWRTFALELAPALGIGAGTSLLATPFTKQLLASEIGGETVNLASNLFTGNSFGRTLSNTSGLPEWLTDLMNPGYLLNGELLIGIGRGISNKIGRKINDINTTIQSQRLLKNIEKTANKALDRGDISEYNRIMNNLKWQNDIPDQGGIGDLAYFIEDIPVDIRREGNNIFVLHNISPRRKPKWEEIEFNNKIDADLFEKGLRESMQDKNLWKQMSKDFGRLGHGSRIALVTNSDMSINSAPLYYGQALRYARAGKGEIIPVVDNGIQRMIKLNNMGNRGKKYNQAIDKWNNEIRLLLGNESIPNRVSFLGDDYIPAYYFRKFDNGGTIIN